MEKYRNQKYKCLKVEKLIFTVLKFIGNKLKLLSLPSKDFPSGCMCGEEREQLSSKLEILIQCKNLNTQWICLFKFCSYPLLSLWQMRVCGEDYCVLGHARKGGLWLPFSGRGLQITLVTLAIDPWVSFITSWCTLQLWEIPLGS